MKYLKFGVFGQVFKKGKTKQFFEDINLILMSISLNCAGTRAYLINTCTIYDKTKFSPFAYMHSLVKWNFFLNYIRSISHRERSI